MMLMDVPLLSCSQWVSSVIINYELEMLLMSGPHYSLVYRK